MPDAEPFWNLTGGRRPHESYPGMFRGICDDMGHVHDGFYGPDECARCGYREPRRRWWQRKGHRA